MTSNKTILEAAMAYAEKGYYVFPCEPKGKKPLTPNGFKNATNDKAKINNWWDNWPNANIGLALKPSNLLVVDLDRHEGKGDGVESFKQINKGRPVPGPVAITGGGGLHLITIRPEGEINHKPSPGIDVIDNGYILVSPSIHRSGKQYRWKEGRSLLEYEPQDPPDWLWEAIVKKELVKQKPNGSVPHKTKDKYPSSSAELIAQRCAFMKHAKDDAAILSEPDWYHAIGLLVHTEEAPDIIHDYSYGHPGYSYSETTQKSDHWIKDGHGPPTCKTIQTKCSDKYCATCPYNGHIKSPIVLGYSSNNKQDAKQVLPFPVEALPVVYGEYITHAAMALQCPVDYVACSILVVASILIGGKKNIELSPEWHQYANIWMALIGGPSAKKSPALSKAFEPIRAIEKKLTAEYQKNKSTYEMQKIQYEEDLKVWKKNRETDPPLEPKKPILERLTTSDTTIEALGELLANNPHGIASVCDELSSWMRSMNQYKGGKGADRSHYLAMWSNAPVTIDRKGKEPIVIPSPYLSLIGLIQPDVLLELNDNGIQDGMKERFLFCYPPAYTEPPKRKQAIPPNLKTQLSEALSRIYQGRTNEVKTITLSENAHQAFINIQTEWYNIKQASDFDTGMEAYYTKMESYVGRLGLIIHEIKRSVGEVNSDVAGLETIQEAKALIEYFLNHAIASFGLVNQTPESRKVQRTVVWIKKKGLTTISPRDLYTNQVAGCQKASQAKGMLILLQDYGHGFWNNETSRFIFYH